MVALRLACLYNSGMNVKEFARLGGRARAAKLTKERRIEIARNAGLASSIKRKHASKRETCQSDETTGIKN